jgi:hypothetical protein
MVTPLGASNIPSVHWLSPAAAAAVGRPVYLLVAHQEQALASECHLLPQGMPPAVLAQELASALGCHLLLQQAAAALL